MTPKHLLLTLIFACLCLKKSLFIKFWNYCINLDLIMLIRLFWGLLRTTLGLELLIYIQTTIKRLPLRKWEVALNIGRSLKDGAYFCQCAHVWRITQGRFKRHVRAGVDTDAINYATKYRTKMKAKFSHCDSIKFNELVLKPGTPQQQHMANHELLTSSSWKTSCYLSKIILKSNCKRVPADGVVRGQNKFEIPKCFTYWGGDRKICNGH